MVQVAVPTDELRGCSVCAVRSLAGHLYISVDDDEYKEVLNWTSSSTKE